MADKKPFFSRRFSLGLLIYALAFLLLLGIGFIFFWDFIDAYEQSRPQHPLNAYMEQLTADYILDKSDAAAAQIDSRLQSKEQSLSYLESAIADDLKCIKKIKACTDSKLVYSVFCGPNIIGTIELERQGEARFGFAPWVITGDSFDISCLLQKGTSVTVPADFYVYAGQTLLDETFLTETDIPYSAVKEFYASHTLPAMVTYSVGTVLGELPLRITDAQGNEVTLEENTDMNKYLDNCSADTKSQLDSAIDGFVRAYVDFTSCTGGDTYANYNKLARHLVPGGELAQRMRSAIDGLYWVSDRHAVLDHIDVHHYVRTGEGKYICTLTYAVNTNTFNGSTQASSNIKLVFAETANGLRAEGMLNY